MSGRRVVRRGLELASTHAFTLPNKTPFLRSQRERHGLDRRGQPLERTRPVRRRLAADVDVELFGWISEDRRSHGEACSPPRHCVPRLRVEGPARGWISSPNRRGTSLRVASNNAAAASPRRAAATATAVSCVAGRRRRARNARERDLLRRAIVLGDPVRWRTVEVTAKQYSDHPALRLCSSIAKASSARGWISQRLNQRTAAGPRSCLCS